MKSTYTVYFAVEKRAKKKNRPKITTIFIIRERIRKLYELTGCV